MFFFFEILFVHLHLYGGEWIHRSLLGVNRGIGKVVIY